MIGYILLQRSDGGNGVSFLEFHDAHALRGAAEYRNGCEFGADYLSLAGDRNQFRFILSDHLAAHHLAGLGRDFRGFMPEPPRCCFL